MIRNSVLCIVLVVAGWVGAPFSYAEEGETHEEALLASVFPQSCHFSGKFVQQKTMEGLPVPLTSDGDFFYSCDLGLVWRTVTPFEEAILYVNSSNNYRIDESGELQPLSGIARYIMSSVFVKLLNGDTDYFLDAFSVSEADGESVLLTPESDYMKKGLDRILFEKSNDDELGITLGIKVTDATGQVTSVNIDQIKEFDAEGKRDAFEKCESLYPENEELCRVLRSPTSIR
ncbi:outer membrane lipoprotein carrier protein LolA [Alteromonas sp. H39]|uniref:outer membrane lipoprotein carrier protein LolA n=1 Tax=Alteromonas sp. H39 TaxID=3389876 RepID=UPI0039E14455